MSFTKNFQELNTIPSQPATTTIAPLMNGVISTFILQWQEQDAIFPVVECRLRYKSAARYDDLLMTEVWVTKAEGVRLNFGYRIVSQAKTLVLEAETFHVCAGLDEKPKRLPANSQTDL